MEGTPLRISVMNFTNEDKMLLEYSVIYMPESIPTGIPITDPILIRIRLPTIAFAIPPPSSPTGLGSCVKKSRLRDDIPDCVV